MTLEEHNKAIRSREELVEFVKALSDDFRDNSDSWENANLQRFLDALGAWVEDMDGYYQNQGQLLPEQPTWKVIGDILMAAKVYE